MLPDHIIEKYRNDAEGLAKYFSAEYFNTHERTFPINPFHVLTDLGIHFVFRNFKDVEGLFLPAMKDGDVDLVAINAKRPITRQRFTASHELCHYLKDPREGKSFICETGAKNIIEKYADAFASAFLMPPDELKAQIDQRGKVDTKLTCDDVLIIADHFGTSFEACYWRIRNLYTYLAPSVSAKKKYKPAKKREEYGMSEVCLYSDLFDRWPDITTDLSTDFAKQVFENSYIYNDARLEGVHATLESAAEIVNDLQSNMQKSSYCNPNYEPYCHIAGHAKLYQRVFENYSSKSFTIYEIRELNKLLFSTFPFPDTGGQFRQEPAIITKSDVETCDWHEIPKEISALDQQEKDLEDHAGEYSKSTILKELLKIHYRLTVIHPFRDGNGRTSRGFLNEELMRFGFPPMYIKIERKDEYRAALAQIDHKGDYTMLFEFMMKNLISSHVELSIR